MPRIRWFPSEPPSVIVGDDVSLDDEGLRFRITRAVSLARPAHILLFGTTGSEGRVHLEGLAAAFGPPGSELPPDAARFAADLWRVLPARAQTSLRELLRNGVDSFDATRGLAEERAAECGLLADGSIARSLRALARDDETLGSHPFGDEAAYVRAARASATLRALVRFAFDAANLAARASWLRESPRPTA
jgi:hypothetical protein